MFCGAPRTYTHQAPSFLSYPCSCFTKHQLCLSSCLCQSNLCLMSSQSLKLICPPLRMSVCECMSTACPQYVCLQYIYSMPTACLQHAYSMSIVCLQYVYNMPTVYMSTVCLQYVYSMPTVCMSTICVSTVCLQYVYSMYVYSMSTVCVSTVQSPLVTATFHQAVVLSCLGYCSPSSTSFFFLSIPTR